MSSNNSIKTSRWSRFLQRRSISRRLLAWSFSVLVLVGALASFQLSYSIRKEMLELVDNNLIQYANSLYMLEQQVQGYGHVSEPLKFDDEDEEDKDKRDKKDHSSNKSSNWVLKNKSSTAGSNGYGIAFQIWDAQSKQLIIRSKNATDTPMKEFKTGFSNQKVGEQVWRTYVHFDREKQRVIVVAQEQALTDHIISETVMRLITPILLGFLVLLGLFYWIIHRSLRPLSELNRAIGQRSPLNLQPIQVKKAPAEITPVVNSINTLMHTLEDSLNKERHFTGNAAHELRTPLAVIDTLAQTAIKTQDPSILPKIKAATDHARRQIEQLLTLARLDANAGLNKIKPRRLICMRCVKQSARIYSMSMPKRLKFNCMATITASFKAPPKCSTSCSKTLLTMQSATPQSTASYALMSARHHSQAYKSPILAQALHPNNWHASRNDFIEQSKSTRASVLACRLCSAFVNCTKPI